MKRLEGNTASLSVLNGIGLRIKILSDERLQYQFIYEGIEEPIEEAHIYSEVDHDSESDDPQPCFYIFNNRNTGRRYFVHDFCRDDMGPTR